MRVIPVSILPAVFLLSLSASGQAGVVSVKKSLVSFVSVAPLERIVAASTQAAGVIDLDKRTFLIRVPMRSFNGFNSPLQQEHFNENYVESGVDPHAIFEGRIIEACDLRKPGVYQVRAKGGLAVHGVMQERIIPCSIVVDKDGVRVRSEFDLPLVDHAIRIPRVVQQKIAAVVMVKVDLWLSNVARR